MNFGRTLNFTSSNEDGATELAALRLGPQDHVLCLTASGARPLDLLLGNPGRVTAIDINPAQNELLRLKIAAWHALDDETLYAWLGLMPCRHRLDLQARIDPLLPPASRAFWQARRSAIARGVWHTGRWERVLAIGAFGTGLVRGRHLHTLFEAPDLETQVRIWADHFDDALWRSIVRMLSRRWFWTQIIGEPGGAFLPAPQQSEERLTGLFRRAAANFLFRDSDFATLVFFGRLRRGNALPLHLQPENIPVVRKRLDRIIIAEAGLADLGTDELGSFDAFSLSDFGSYCRGNAYDSAWSGVLASASDHARFCERIFMNPATPGEALSERICINNVQSAALTRSDRAIIYDIRCGELRSG